MKTFLRIYKKAGVLIFFVVEIILWSILSPQFFTFNNIIGMLRQISMLGVVTVGTCFVMLGGSGTDLSVAGEVPLLSLFAGAMMTQMNIPAIPTMLITIAMGAVIGLVNGLIIKGLRIMPFVVTLSTMNIFTGMASLFSGGYNITNLPDSFRWLGQGMLWKIPAPVIVMILVVLLAHLVLKKTYFGRAIYAMGGNPEAARLAGINVDKYRVATFVISGACAAVTALIMSSRTMVCSPSAGSSYAFQTMTCCVLGGISFGGGSGKVWGAFVGTLVIGALNNAMNLLNVPDYWQTIILGIIFILALLMDRTQQETSVKE